MGQRKKKPQKRKQSKSIQGKEQQPSFLETSSTRQQQLPTCEIDCRQMSFAISRNLEFHVSWMDGDFAIARLNKSGDDMKVKAEFFQKSDHVLKFDAFLRYKRHPNLIVRVDSFECKPKDLKHLVSTVNNPAPERKTFIIVYQKYESTIDQLLKDDKSETFWKYKVMTHGVKRAFITPAFQNFWNNYVDCLLYLHKNGFKHGAIDDLKRCVLLSEDNLQSFKVIPSGTDDNKEEEEDLSGLSVMMSKLSPDCTCLYHKHAREFLTNSERSVIDTLKILKEHPFLAPPSNLKKMLDDVSQIWGQTPNSRVSAESRFFGPFIANMKRTKHYQKWADQIEEWIVSNAKRAEQNLKSASGEQIKEECIKQMKQIKNMGACLQHKITEYHNYSFVELVRYLNNKFKHAWERDIEGNNEPATFTEAEFIDIVIDIFPEIYVILFEYIYRSKSHFHGPHHPGEKYPSEGYSIMDIDLRFKKRSLS